MIREPDQSSNQIRPQQQAIVLTRLRDMILNGRLGPGERLGEVAMTALLGASRTPIRYALQTLSQEGLVEPAGRRGYRVRIFQPEYLDRAIEVRAVLEGLAARQVCERGASAALLATLGALLLEGDRLVANPEFGADHIAEYADMNGRFHDAIVDAADNEPLATALRRNDRLPFASSRSVAFNHSNRTSEVMRLKVAHWQHHQLVAILAKGESARAEALMREHAHLAKASLSVGIERTTDAAE